MAVSSWLSAVSRGRCRPGINEPLRDRIDGEIEPFERSGAQQGEVSRLGKDHVINGTGSGEMDERVSDPALDHRAAGLPELRL